MQDGTVYFIWETATETGNAGFRIYMEVDGELSLVTPDLLPSQVIDSVTPVRYAYQARVEGERYYIDMINIAGDEEAMVLICSVRNTVFLQQ